MFAVAVFAADFDFPIGMRPPDCADSGFKGVVHFCHGVYRAALCLTVGNDNAIQVHVMISRFMSSRGHVEPAMTPVRNELTS